MTGCSPFLGTTAPRGPKWQPGFTLLELMVTLAVLGIIAAIAFPSMSTLINNNRLAAATSELAAGLQLARSEAIRRNARIEVCSTSDGETCASDDDWAHWVVLGADRETNEIIVLRDFQTPNGVDLVGPSTSIVFRPSGLLERESALVVCAPKAHPEENRREVTVMVSGRVAVSKTAGGSQCET